MGKKRSRNTAKTGDKALYRNNRPAPPVQDNDDPMYDQVDRFHAAQEEFIRLDNDEQTKSDEEEPQQHTRAVLDLGVNDDDDDSSSSSSSSSNNDHSDNHSTEEAALEPDAASTSSEDSEEEEEDEDEIQDVRDWGSKKSIYYRGDTADLEIGQDAEDAVLEEEAAKELQATRLAEMDEQDFLLSDDDDNGTAEASWNDKKGSTAESMKNRKQTLKQIRKQHSELFPLLAHFTGIVNSLRTQTSVAHSAIFDGPKHTAESIGATPLGLKYLSTKHLLECSAALNLASYLLLKIEHAQNGSNPELMQCHPVLLALQKINKRLQSLEGLEGNGLAEQLGNVVKAAELLRAGHVLSDLDSGSENENEKETVEDSTPQPTSARNESADSIDDYASRSDDSSAEERVTRERGLLNEARFGLRPGELVVASNDQRVRRPAAFDVGDDDDGLKPTKKLSSTLNSIEQRILSRNTSARRDTEALDEHQEDDGELRRGLDMMEAELGTDEDLEAEMDDGEPGVKSNDEEDDYYTQVAQKSRKRKKNRTEKYAVAPKYPRVEQAIEGERALSRTIMKNRGLVPHKNKLNRNPRVKKREQFRKALIRRKGAVREVRTDEGHKYGGEDTGIKTGLSRSRKL